MIRENWKPYQTLDLKKGFNAAETPENGLEFGVFFNVDGLLIWSDIKLSTRGGHALGQLGTDWGNHLWDVVPSTTASRDINSFFLPLLRTIPTGVLAFGTRQYSDKQQKITQKTPHNIQPNKNQWTKWNKGRYFLVPGSGRSDALFSSKCLQMWLHSHSDFTLNPTNKNEWLDGTWNKFASVPNTFSWLPLPWKVDWIGRDFSQFIVQVPN